jgi:hypothetical protein
MHSRPVTDYNIEYRLINGTGERWVSAQGRGVYKSDGAVSGMHAASRDAADYGHTAGPS